MRFALFNRFDIVVDEKRITNFYVTINNYTIGFIAFDGWKKLIFQQKLAEEQCANIFVSEVIKIFQLAMQIDKHIASRLDCWNHRSSVHDVTASFPVTISKRFMGFFSCISTYMYALIPPRAASNNPKETFSYYSFNSVGMILFEHTHLQH